MMEDNKIIAIPIKEEETVLSLPIKKKELGEFISSLLGQQQSIERNIEAKFDIDHAWLINLHEMISQRIHQQADAHLTNFSSIIYLEGGLKRTFTSVEAFNSYSENKKSIPVGVKIIWVYLINFPSKGYPEKQQITFSAQIYSKNRSEAKHSKTDDDIELLEIFNFVKNDSGRSAINYQIDHTERTWGDDIEVILANQTSQVLRNSPIKDALFQIFRLLLFLSIFLYSLLYPIYSDISNNSEFISKARQDYSLLQNKEKNDFQWISKKIDYVANVVINNVGSKNMKDIKNVIWILVGSTISAFILVLTRKNTYSFLVLSKESEKYREQKLRREKRSVLILIVSFLLSVFSGIIGNYGYAWLTR